MNVKYRLLCLDNGGLNNLTKNKIYLGERVDAKMYRLKDDFKVVHTFPIILFAVLEDKKGEK